MDTKEIFELIEQENQRQENEICLIASENYTSKDVMKAQGSCLTQKYAEGYPGHRYYAGCEIIDKIEQGAIDNACKLFNCKFANVQPHSGASANLAVLKAFCTPNPSNSLYFNCDSILGMRLDEGGHLTHGSVSNISGKWFESSQYVLDDKGYLDYNDIKNKLGWYKPRLLIIGASAYPREIDFKRIRDIVDEYNENIIEYWKPEIDRIYRYWDSLVGTTHKLTKNEIYDNLKCIMMVDMAHIAGLVATGLHQSPLPYADVVTSTTHKTLRGPRGGIILWNNEEYTKKINSAVFPGCQGGPLEHVIAGKAICFAEALQPEFKEYTSQILKNIKAMEKVFHNRGVKMVSGGSDTHLILLDLSDKKFSGKDLENKLSEIGIITNKNAIHNDSKPKTETSGIRIGTAAITTRGANESDCHWVANKICDIIEILDGTFDYDGLDILRVKKDQYDLNVTLEDLVIDSIKEQVLNWCKEHPIYKEK